MATSAVLIEFDDFHDIYSTSGLLFGNNYVLAPSNIFLKILNVTNETEEWMKSNSFGKLHPVNLTGLDKKIRILKNEKNIKDAEIVAAFHCKNITHSAPKVLSDWCIDIDDSSKQLKDALSLFVVLKIKKEVAHRQTKNLMELKTAMFEVLLECCGLDVKRGSKIFTESTPFGNRSFINSYSAGIVSNIVGNNDCFMLIDAPNVPGSEGGPVYGITARSNKSSKYPVGIILASLTWWRGEYVGLSLCAKLHPLLIQLFQNDDLFPNQSDLVNKAVSIINTPLSSIFKTNSKYELSFVQVFCGSSWGTGIIVNLNKGIVLTNSHVVINDNVYPIKVNIRNNIVPCKLLYKTPDAMIFDVAILKCNSTKLKCLNMESATMASDEAKTGEKVIAVGYPFFSQTIVHVPTISCGHISSVNNSILKTTCSVHPGFSGGGIMRKNGEIVGIIVCNTRLSDKKTNVIYPNINMSIPWRAIKNVLENYCSNEDITVFEQLHQTDPDIKENWTIKTMSKL